MGNTSYRFLIAFFNAFLWLIVFINYLGWSGAYINVVVSGETQSWANSYFGFQSINTMITALNTTMNSVEFFSVKNFSVHGQWVLNAITGDLVKFITETSASGSIDIVSILLQLVKLLFQPIYLLGTLLILVGHILWYGFQFVAVVLLAFSGAFNVPLDDALTPPLVEGAMRTIQTLI